MTNLLQAIKTIIDNPLVEVKAYYNAKNRINSVGEALENYIKDVFADSFSLIGLERLERFNQVFSYTGNQNNPPDIILRNGDAIEIKKIQSSKNTA